MKTRTLNFTIEIEDNDFVEFNVHKFVSENFGSSLKDYQVMPDTKQMYEKSSHFKKLTKEYYKAKRVRADYINEHLREYDN